MKRPRVTLSFDNGPHPDVTPAVLDILAAHAILATFFVVGKNIAGPSGQALIAEAHRRGHWIGAHTYYHQVPLGRNESDVAAIWELERTDALIGALAHPSRWFRPYGEGGILDQRLLSRAAVDYLCDKRSTCVIWNAVPRDWIDPDGWVETALRQIGERHESLVVLHDIPTGAMAGLPRFLDAALSAGAEFRQEFPRDCILIRDGAPVAPLETYVGR